MAWHGEERVRNYSFLSCLEHYEGSLSGFCSSRDAPSRLANRFYTNTGLGNDSRDMRDERLHGSLYTAFFRIFLLNLLSDGR